MKKIIIALFGTLFLATGVFAAITDDLADFVKSVNTKATVNVGDFQIKVAAEFGTGAPRVDAVVKLAGSPGDAYMCFKIGEATKKPPEEVAAVYVKNKDKGWGAIAKELGIKPGSAEFKALKQGRFMDGDKGDKGDKGGEKGGGQQEQGKGAKGHPKGKK